MPEQSKFAGALGRLNKQPQAPTASDRGSDNEPAPAPLRAVQQGQRRRKGKRSDPEFSPTTFFVRKQTKRKVTQLLLEDANADKDLSDLVEELLAKWLSEHSQV